MSDPRRNSPVSVLFTSMTNSGAWQIRGVQVASARSNWRALRDPTRAEIAAADIVSIIKHADPVVLARIRRAGKPIVHDTVDCWAQPDDEVRVNSAAAAQKLFDGIFAPLAPVAGTIFATMRMREDLRHLVSRSAVIHHHARPDIVAAPPRAGFQVLGYEGSERYLGPWAERIEAISAERGLAFVVNPASLGEIDAGIALRGGEWDGYMSRNYKSNVKLVNLQAAGRPAIVARNAAGYLETDGGHAFFVDSEDDIKKALDRLASADLRQRLFERQTAFAARFSLAAVADEFEAFFLSLLGGGVARTAGASRR
jgi:hypothetical protein